jgi:parvulin-like peptidyl-prolyl isomerase
MSNRLKFSVPDFVQQLKLSSQVPSFVEAILTRQMIATAAKQADLQVSPEELQRAADELRSQNNLWTAEATWAWLQAHHLSLDDFEDMAHQAVLSAKLSHHLFDRAIEPFFAEHQLDYVQVILYEAAFEDHDLAMELYYAIQEQELSFAEVAHRYIPDPEIRRHGGYRGALRRADLRPEVSAAVFAAQPPQVLKPIAVNKQCCLFFVEEIVQPMLDEGLRSQILTTLFEGWLKQQMAEMMGQVDVEL